MVVFLAEDHAVEGPVELHVDPDARLLALHLHTTNLVRYFSKLSELEASAYFL